MHLGVAVGEISGEDVKNPPQGAGRTDPRDSRNEEPDYPADNSPVIDLADAGNQETEHTCNIWIAHNTPLSGAYTSVMGVLFGGIERPVAGGHLVSKAQSGRVACPRSYAVRTTDLKGLILVRAGASHPS